MITSGKKYQKALSAVHMVYRLVNSTFNVKELSLRLTRLLCQFIKAHSARVFILDPEKRKIVMVAIFDNKINMLWEKRQELARITAKERHVTLGNSIIEKRMIGLPLVADETVGAIFIYRRKNDEPFTDFDRELLSVFAEQAVTAIRNLQLSGQQQATILSSMKLIGKLLQKQGPLAYKHAPAYFNVAKAVAEQVHMSQQGIENLYYASILQGAGALDIPYDILAKKSQLTPEEFKIIRDMPSKSAELIRPVEFLKPVLPLILYHHENYDGTGYPSGLKKEQIPLGARIMAVIDAFEAMTGGRPYRKKLSLNEALEEIKHNSGTQFDPKIVRVFCDLYKQRRFRHFLMGMWNAAK